MILLLVVVNFLVSVFNAWSVGRSWPETRAVGGIPRFMSWMGATMASVGFTWCYLVIIAFAAGPAGFGKLPLIYVERMFSLGYLALVVPLLGSGLAITIQSWAHFWRNRTFATGAIAGYNTLADVYNMYSAVKYVPGAWKSASELFDDIGDEKDNGLAKIAIFLCVFAIFGGILTTAAIVRTVAEKVAIQRKQEYI